MTTTYTITDIIASIDEALFSMDVDAALLEQALQFSSAQGRQRFPSFAWPSGQVSASRQTRAPSGPFAASLHCPASPPSTRQGPPAGSRA